MPKVTLPIDSRELLGVKEEDTAVVEGVARRDERQLLGDQEQRVGIARAIVASPAIIGGGTNLPGDLDAETTDQILNPIQRLNVDKVVANHKTRSLLSPQRPKFPSLQRPFRKQQST